MCPVCLTTAVLIAGSVASMGGLAAVAVKKSGVKNAADGEKTTSGADKKPKDVHAPDGDEPIPAGQRVVPTPSTRQPGISASMSCPSRVSDSCQPR